MVLRPTSSENIAFQQQVTIIDDVATQTDTVVQRDWGYNGSFRTYIGYQWCDCCEEIRFTYWNFNNSTQQIQPRRLRRRHHRRNSPANWKSTRSIPAIACWPTTA